MSARSFACDDLQDAHYSRIERSDDAAEITANM